MVEICRAALALPRSPHPGPAGLLLEGLALLVTEGLLAAVPALRQAASAFAGDSVSAVLRRLAETTQAGGTDWGLGIEARSRALMAKDQSAEGFYQEAIGRLGRTQLRTELARAQLLYGEWLRRQGRRTQAREQLRAALAMLEEIGMQAFADPQMAAVSP